MEFKVIFERQFPNNVISTDFKEVGLAGLALARAASGVNFLSPDRVSNGAEGITMTRFEFDLNEETARKSGHFEDKNTVTVRCGGKLDRHVHVGIHVHTDETTGEVNVTWEQALSENDVIVEWANAGYPLNNF